MAKTMRKVRTAYVVNTNMAKTAVVEVSWKQRSPIYGKLVGRVTRFYVHDAESQCKAGDTVRIEEIRPISKLKRWRLLEIVQRQELPDVHPIELEKGLDLTGAEARAELRAQAEVTPQDEEEETEQ